MRLFIRKVHMYAGLFSFSALIVFGIAGLVVTFGALLGERQTAGPVRYQDFQPPPNATDTEVAAAVYGRLGLPLSSFSGGHTLRRDPAGNLAITFYTINGPHNVTVLEKERRVRVQPARANLANFLNNAHATTFRRHPDLRVTLWTMYNEAATWSLLLMAITGIYLWLASRPRFRWAQASFAAGCGAFLLVYVLLR
jgi:uncharacterized iron-regulated membrane protein